VVRLLALVALAGAPALHAQCAPPDEDQPKVRDSLLVSTTWLAQHLSDGDLVILHVDHMSDAYSHGHIPGARHVDAMEFSTGDFDMLPPSVLDSMVRDLGISDASRVVIYGDPWVTGWVFAIMDRLGHGDRTALLDGGLGAWRAEGRPVSTETPRVSRGGLGAARRREPVVDAAWVRAHLADPHVAVLDVRTPDEYAGRGTSHMSNGGHVTGAHAFDWSRIFVHSNEAINGGDSHLLPATDLRTLLREAGVRAGITPVTYCTVGMRASQMYFVLRYLGYDPKFYDGSFNDWTRRGLPTTTGTSRGTP
jgi:thiosulfate/3-mercaptopyruvate sulfurtransferase